MITCPGQAQSIGHRRRDRRAGTTDGNVSHECYGRCRAGTHIPRNPYGPDAALVPSFPDMGTHVGISGNTSYRPASRVAAIRPMVLRRTDFEMGPPRVAAALRP
jgi:hypothetical protein